jgi:hypothetical protein
VEGRFSAPVQTGFGAHTASYALGTGSFSPLVKRPGRGVGHRTPSSAKAKERAELLLAFRACFRMNFTFTFHLVTGKINVACMYTLMMTNDSLSSSMRVIYLQDVSYILINGE